MTIAPADDDTGVSHPRALAYGVGSIGAATFVVAPQLLLLYFLTEVLSIPPAWAGLAVLVPKLWEFVFDPTVGHLSDRTRGRWGRRWPWLTGGALLFPFCFALLFAPPVLADWRWTLVVVTLAFILCTSAYSLFAIPFVTLPGEVSPLAPVRTRVVAWRIGFVGVGILAAGGLAPMLVSAGGGGRAGFAHMGLILSAVSGAAMMTAALAAWGFRHRAIPRDRGDWTRALAHLAGNRSYRWLWVTYGVQMLGMAGNAAMLPYAVTHVLHRPGGTVALLFVAITAGNLLSLPVWVRLSRRLGGMATYRLATLACVLGSVSLYPGIQGGMVLACVACALSGIGQAGQQLLPLSLLPAATEGEDRAAGARHAGLLVGIWVAGEKLGFALGGALAAALLGLAGYKEGGVAQSAAAVSAIPVIFALVPAALFLFSLLPLRRLAAAAPRLGDHSPETCPSET